MIGNECGEEREIAATTGRKSLLAKEYRAGKTIIGEKGNHCCSRGNR